jgi:hypothetical protein
MTENEETKNLTEDLGKSPIAPLSDRQLLELLLQRVTSFEDRLTSIEAYIAARPHDTNPLLEQIYKGVNDNDRRLAALEDTMREVKDELRGMREDLERERKQRFRVEDRLDTLERWRNEAA